MKVVVLTNSSHFAANYILTGLPKNKDIEIVGIIEARNSRTKYAKRIIAIAGILVSLEFLAFFLTLKIFSKLKRIFWKKRRLLEADEIAAKYKIPYFETKNINHKDSIKILKKLKPDLIISNYFEQILKRKVLDIPIKGTINIHPGLLPMYRGTFAYFWKLVNKEKKAGITIHFMTKTLDKGKILAQKSFKITKADTVVDVIGKGAKLGTKMLNRTLRNLKENKIPRIKPRKLKSGYYSFPDKKAVKRFYQNDRKLFTFKSIRQYF
jgi:folate-dependent phosphoribosylglycinamide formyltransferase PurN